MSLWVLDTDMLTLWLRGQETVAARVATTSAPDSGILFESSSP